MNITKLHMFGILAALSMASVGVIVPAAFAEPNAQANPVASNVACCGIDSNQHYMEICMLSSTAQECATGPFSSGVYTSGLAHTVNGP